MRDERTWLLRLRYSRLTVHPDKEEDSRGTVQKKGRKGVAMKKMEEGIQLSE